MTATIRVPRPKVYLWTSHQPSERIDLAEDLLGFTFSKRLGSPEGSWSIQLAPRQMAAFRLGHVLRPVLLERLFLHNSPVSLGMDEPGGITMGLVSRVESAQSRQGVSGPVTRTLSLGGADLGKVFTQDNIQRAGLNLTSNEQRRYLTGIGSRLGTDSPLYASFLDVLGPTNRYDPDASPTFVGQTVQAVVDWCLEKMGSMRIPLLGAAYGGDGRLSTYVQTSEVRTGDGDLVWNDSLATYQGTVWGFLQQVLDPDLYEIRLDCRPNGEDGVPLPFLIIRPKPFDEPAWTHLEVGGAYGTRWTDLETFVKVRSAHRITDADILDARFLRSDDEVVNHVNVIAKHELIGNAEAAARGLNYPATDMGSVSLFGLRAMQAHLSLVGGDVQQAAEQTDDYTSELALTVRRQRNRLLSWYRYNPFDERATVTVIGRDEFRVGDPVELVDREAYLASDEDRRSGAALGMRYYCTGVDQRWSFGGHYTTTLTLERGHNDALRREARRILAQGELPDYPDNLNES